MGPKTQNEMWEEDLEDSILGNVGDSDESEPPETDEDDEPSQEEDE